jgi:hypothetical protein
MRIIALIPCWKRPEVLNLTIKNLPKWIKPVYIISPDDPMFFVNKGLMLHYDVDFAEYKNYPVGDKMNRSIEYICDNYDFDYLMNLNSDNLVHPDLIKYYTDSEFQSLSDLYFMELKSKKIIEVKGYNLGMSFGAGRLISKKLLKEIKGDIYNRNYDSGLDTCSYNVIKNYSKLETINTPFPMICDVKTNTNINTWEWVENLGVDCEIPKWVQDAIL